MSQGGCEFLVGGSWIKTNGIVHLPQVRAQGTILPYEKGSSLAGR